MRTGLLARHLADAGHDVMWWASRFDHGRRRRREIEQPDVAAGRHLTIRLLEGRGYQRSVGLARLRHHRAVAADFRARASFLARPDIIVCCMPTLELADAATRYGEEHGVPVLLDLRDLWPDIFVEMMPRFFRPAGRLLMRRPSSSFAATCSRATGLIGITDEFLNWGLAYAGRERRPSDLVVPHAYPSDTLPAEVIAKAEKLWDTLTVTDAPDAFVVSFVGTLSRRLERQGFLGDAIEAMSRLSERCPRLKLVICGDGEMLHTWSDKAATLPNVVVPGRFDHAGIWALLARSRVGLVPYPNSPDFSRSIPNKVGEYLSMGLPITSSLDGAVGRFLREHGCGETYPAGDPARLADIWVRLYEDRSKWEQMSRRASEAYSAHLSADTVYPGLVTHLEQVAAAHSRGLTA